MIARASWLPLTPSRCDGDDAPRLHEAKLRMGSVTLLGTGGAARAALVALHLVGISAVRIQARDMAAAKKLCVEFGLDVGPEQLTAPIASDGLINATPLGMSGRDCLNCDVSRLPQGGWVFDMVYDRLKRPWSKRAREQGLTVMTGLDMWSRRRRPASSCLGQDPPRDRDSELSWRSSSEITRALTGSIAWASRPSARCFAEAGIPVFDADASRS